MIERMKTQTTTPRRICGGVWWCLECKAPADIEDPGEPHTRCARCGTRKCEWRPTEEPGEATETSAPTTETVPVEAHPVFSQRRLPASERPTLAQMTYEGYLLCLACQQPTKRDEQDCCVLCGSSQVEFQPPTVPSN